MYILLKYNIKDMQDRLASVAKALKTGTHSIKRWFQRRRTTYQDTLDFLYYTCCMYLHTYHLLLCMYVCNSTGATHTICIYALGLVHTIHTYIDRYQRQGLKTPSSPCSVCTVGTYLFTDLYQIYFVYKIGIRDRINE